jgi:hypothetical protein
LKYLVELFCVGFFIHVWLMWFCPEDDL